MIRNGITVREAARQLGISESYVVKLVQTGEIEQVGQLEHHRTKLLSERDVMICGYKRKMGMYGRRVRGVLVVGRELADQAMALTAAGLRVTHEDDLLLALSEHENYGKPIVVLPLRRLPELDPIVNRVLQITIGHGHHSIDEYNLRELTRTTWELVEKRYALEQRKIERGDVIRS